MNRDHSCHGARYNFRFVCHDVHDDCDPECLNAMVVRTCSRIEAGEKLLVDSRRWVCIMPVLGLVPNGAGRSSTEVLYMLREVAPRPTLEA